MDSRNTDRFDTSTSTPNPSCATSNASTTRIFSQDEVFQLLEDNSLLSEHVDHLESHRKQLKAKLTRVSSELMSLTNKYSDACRSVTTVTDELVGYVGQLAGLYDLPTSTCSSPQSLGNILREVVLAVQRERSEATEKGFVSSSTAVLGNLHSGSKIYPLTSRCTQSPTESAADLPQTPNSHPLHCPEAHLPSEDSAPLTAASSKHLLESSTPNAGLKRPIDPEANVGRPSKLRKLDIESSSAVSGSPTSSAPELSSAPAENLNTEQPKLLTKKQRKRERSKHKREERLPLIFSAIEQGLYRLGEEPPSNGSKIFIKDKDGIRHKFYHTKGFTEQIREKLRQSKDKESNAIEDGKTDSEGFDPSAHASQVEPANKQSPTQTSSPQFISIPNSLSADVSPLGLHGSDVSEKGRNISQEVSAPDDSRNCAPDSGLNAYPPPPELKKLIAEFCAGSFELYATPSDPERCSDSEEIIPADGSVDSWTLFRQAIGKARTHRWQEAVTPLIITAIEQGVYRLGEEPPRDGSIVVIKDKNGMEHRIQQSKKFSDRVLRILRNPSAYRRTGPASLETRNADKISEDVDMFSEAVVGAEVREADSQL